MLLPMTAVGPLNVETKPILIVSGAKAGFASARAVAPASQNAVLIFVSLLDLFYPARQANCPARSKGARACHSRESSPLKRGILCAKSQGSGKHEPPAPLRTFGPCLNGHAP